MSVAKIVRRFFFRGLAALLPTIVTIWLLVWGFRFIQNNISLHINRGIVWLVMALQGLDWTNAAARQPLVDFWVHGWGSMAGFMAAVLVVCIVGVILASMVGRAFYRMIEKFLMNIPVLRRVYPYVKQITDFLLTEERLAFLRVVAVQYPRKGIWSMGMVTGRGLRKVSESQKKEFLTILIPTSPTPFTGFVIIVPKDEVIDLDMTIEEGFRFSVSGGVVTPLQERIEEKADYRQPKKGETPDEDITKE